MRRTSTPFLFSRGHTLYFRRTVPIDLRSRFRRDEIKVSLRTKNAAIARVTVRTFATRFEVLMGKVRSMPSLTQKQIDEFVRSYFEVLASEAAEYALLLPHDPMIDLDHEISGSLEDIERYRRRLAQRHYGPAIRHVAFELLEEREMDPLPEKGEDLDKLCHGILRAKIEQRRVLVAMLQGSYGEVVPEDPLFSGIDTTKLADLDVDGNWKTSGSLEQIGNDYCVYKRNASEWNDKTLADNRRVLGWFGEFVGAKVALTSVGKEHIRSFRDLLLTLPPNFSKKSEYEGMTVQEIAAANEGGTTVSGKTAAKYFDSLKAFFQWCEAEEHLVASPAEKVKLKYKHNPQSARLPFSREQLETLFASPMFTGCKSLARRSNPGAVVERDAYYWIPLVALFSGMRLGEIVQLSLSDIKQTDGIDYFAVTLTGEEGKTLKTLSSARQIPVHPTLVELGFMDFVKLRTQSESGARVFSEIGKGADGYYSHNVSKWFGRYFRKVGVNTSNTAFHSFRHSFVDGLREAQVGDSRIKALVGHSDTSVTSAYGTKYPISSLFEDIRKISYDLDWGHLDPDADFQTVD